MTLSQLLNAFFDAIFPKHSLTLEKSVTDILWKDPVSVIDVGGAMGSDERWGTLKGAARFMFFEPDVRSQQDLGAHSERDVVVAAGLGGSEGTRTLYLTEGPFASSLFRANREVLRNFSVWPWYRPAGQAEVDVKTLDGVLQDFSGWTPDFIKVDVEGADLEVLAAGKKALASSFGVQIEVSFLDRNVGAPGYGVADQWLRAEGFIPHLLIREHWSRKNGVWGINTNAQISWADAVYFRPEAWILERLNTNSEHAERDLSVFVALLLVYGCHDMAIDMIRAASQSKLVEDVLASELEKSVLKSITAPGTFLLRGLMATLLALIPAGAAWLLGGSIRAAGRDLLSRQAFALFSGAQKVSSRKGLDRSCITDRE